jgi:hypothetical protein
MLFSSMPGKPYALSTDFNAETTPHSMHIAREYKAIALRKETCGHQIFVSLIILINRPIIEDQRCARPYGEFNRISPGSQLAK